MIPVLAKIVAGVVGPALEGFFGWKKGEQEKTVKLEEFEVMKQTIEANLRIQLAQEMNKPDSEFKKFMLDYEGKAEDMPRFIQILRSSVRPVVTYWSLILITWLMFSGSLGEEFQNNMAAIPDQLWYIFLAVFGFWFGGRALQHAVEANNKGKLMTTQAESQAQVEVQRETTRQEMARRDAEQIKNSREAIRAGIHPATVNRPAPAKPNDGFNWESLEFE